MKRSTNYVTNIFILTCLLVFSCDSFKDDVVMPENQVLFGQTDFYTLPGSSIIIDLASTVQRSFSRASLSVSRNPGKGSLKEVGSQLFKYRPSTEFKEGQDNFIVSVTVDGKIVSEATFSIYMKKTKDEFPCTLIPVEDKIKLETTSKSIPILENDWLCEIDRNTLSISLHSQPLYGQATIEGESIRYAANPSFKGQDSFIYNLKTAGGKVSYGLVSISNWTEQSLQQPFDSPREMVFVDENIGYLVGSRFGESGIQKTTDGGEHWFDVSPPKNVALGDLIDVSFLNEREGAVLSVCDPDWGDCEMDLITTNNGGQNWEVKPIDAGIYINSIFFISSSTGFAGSTRWDRKQNEILKTEDSGKTWRRVFTTPDPEKNQELGIKFLNEQVGYAYQTDKIFITEDGGESWKTFTTYEHIPAMTLGSVDKVFASLTSLSVVNNSSSIVRFENESSSKAVAKFSYKIEHLEFSPSGNIGFAVGAKEDVQLGTQLFINISIDGGETWTEEQLEGHYIDSPYDLTTISVPSDDVAYILIDDKLIKYFQ